MALRRNGRRQSAGRRLWARVAAAQRGVADVQRAQEALALRQYDSARAAIKNWVEMPDQDADRIIRSLQQQQWHISHQLRKSLPQIFQEDGVFYSLHPHIVAAVRAAFEGD